MLREPFGGRRGAARHRQVQAHLADGFRVDYAIADVPAFVDPDGAIAREALRRGQTIYAPDRRITLAFPSPFLRNEPAVLHLEGGTPGTPSAFESHEVISYDSSFKRELIAFHRNVVERTEPITSAADAVRDIALCQAIVACHRTGRPIEEPTRLD